MTCQELRRDASTGRTPRAILATPFKPFSNKAWVTQFFFPSKCVDWLLPVAHPLHHQSAATLAPTVHQRHRKQWHTHTHTHPMCQTFDETFGYRAPSDSRSTATARASAKTWKFIEYTEVTEGSGWTASMTWLPSERRTQFWQIIFKPRLIWVTSTPTWQFQPNPNSSWTLNFNQPVMSGWFKWPSRYD